MGEEGEGSNTKPTMRKSWFDIMAEARKASKEKRPNPHPHPQKEDTEKGLNGGGPRGNDQADPMDMEGAEGKKNKGNMKMGRSSMSVKPMRWIKPWPSRYTAPPLN